MSTIKWFLGWLLGCRLVGHDWRRLEDTPAPAGWWYENSRCARCGRVQRQMVAGREG